MNDVSIKIVNGTSDKLLPVNEKAIVIMSTYNGEKYIAQQLDSLIKQKHISVSILIRDDGSTDNTVSILKEYKTKFDNIDYYLGDNLGVIGSFNDLLMRSELEKYQYIAFCDQDDVWDDDKLVIAISYLMNEQYNTPLMYCSNLMLVDRELNSLRPMRKVISKYTLEMSLIQNIGTGCTQVFNHQALMEYRKGIGMHMEMHDYWLTLECMFLGKIIYDNNPHISYRQHSDNVIGARDKDVSHAIYNLKSTGHRITMLKDFINTYDLHMSDINIINGIVLYDRSFINRIKLFFSVKYIGFDSRVTIGFKFRSIIKKLY